MSSLARHLAIAPSSAVRNISSLEHEFNTRLFDRTRDLVADRSAEFGRNHSDHHCPLDAASLKHLESPLP